MLANNRTQILFILILCVPLEPGSYVVNLFGLKHVVVSLPLLSDVLNKHRHVIGFRPINGNSTGVFWERVYSLTREIVSLSVSSVCGVWNCHRHVGTMRQANQHSEKARLDRWMGEGLVLEDVLNKPSYPGLM